MRRASLALALAASISGAGCGDRAAPSITSLALLPSSATITSGHTQELLASASLSDGTTEDVTSAARWSSSDERVAVVAGGSVAPGGFASGVSKGTATISADYAGVTGATTLTVMSP